VKRCLMLIGGAVVALELIVVVLGVAGAAGTNENVDGFRNVQSDGTITLDKFNSIQTGMSCDALPGLIGGPGRVVSDSNVGVSRPPCTLGTVRAGSAQTRM
jgi:hypothetical protein